VFEQGRLVSVGPPPPKWLRRILKDGQGK
jgi:hypothetical protein